MNKDFFDIKDIKDFVRLLVFLVDSPVIGIVMFIGMFATSVSLVCMYIKCFIMEKFYEQN